MNHRETMLRLNVALSNIDSAYAIIAKRHGLTFNALMMIYMMEESEDITQKQICKVLHLPKSTVHSIILEFIKQGYVSLAEGANKKEKYIAITAMGKKYFKEIFEQTNRIEKNVLSALGNDTCDFLTQTVEMLGNLMKKEVQETYGGEV